MALKIHISIAGISLPINSINQPRNPEQAVLYNNLAEVHLLHHTPGLNIFIDKNMTVVDVTSARPQHIADGWYVYQVDNDKLTIEKGARVELNYAFHSPITNISDDYDFVIGGAGLLIQDGKVVTNALYDEFSQGNTVVHCHDEVAADFHTKQMQEWLIELRHPRTAVGITANNDLCLVVIDGRQKASEGLSLNELAQFMKSLGCVHAINMGGGGCTTLYIDGAVVNSPSANEERPVSEALCLYVPATT